LYALVRISCQSSMVDKAQWHWHVCMHSLTFAIYHIGMWTRKLASRTQCALNPWSPLRAVPLHLLRIPRASISTTFRSVRDSLRLGCLCTSSLVRAHTRAGFFLTCILTCARSLCTPYARSPLQPRRAPPPYPLFSYTPLPPLLLQAYATKRKGTYTRST